MGAYTHSVRVAPAAGSSRAAQFGALAVASLIDEARLAPKPGLVDSRGSGAHADLDLALMERSAWSLRPAFAAMAQAGESFGAPTIELREALGRLGREAEATMMATTGGINTHRGAIWALGLLVAAAAIERGTTNAGQTAAVAATAGAIARHADRHAPHFTGHKGEQACRAFNVAGARGQAQAGFPHVIGLGLPELRRSRARGDSETSARLNALLAIISKLDDTCVLSRGGHAALTQVQRAAAAVLAAGGAATLAGRRSLQRFAADAVACNLSPGGAADLLAATLFLDRIGSVDETRLAHRSFSRGLHGKA
jgi:triphosphoribosyl-dephospho-CoA synthase